MEASQSENVVPVITPAFSIGILKNMGINLTLKELRSPTV
jgi:hypothetical protein